jgi:hypothetical protein
MTRHNGSMLTIPQTGMHPMKKSAESTGEAPEWASFVERHPLVHGEHMTRVVSMATALNRFINETSRP